MGEVGDGAFDDPGSVAGGFAEENGGRGVAVSDAFLTKWSVRCPGRTLSSRLFDFRAHNDPVPIFRIADAFCVSGFDEPVNDAR